MATPRTRRRTTRSIGSTLIVCLAVASCITAGALILVHRPVLAGAFALLGGAASVVGWFLAGAEGTPRARFAALVADPICDACVLLPIAWAWREASPVTSVLAIVCLGLAYVAAYERAKADALGYRTFEGVGYRAARSVIPAVGLLFDVVLPSLWVLAVLTGAAAAARAVNVAMQERRTSRPRGADG